MLDERDAILLALDEVKDIMSNTQLNAILDERELIRQTINNLKIQTQIL